MAPTDRAPEAKPVDNTSSTNIPNKEHSQANGATSNARATASPNSTAPKLTGAEIKAQKKAEKAARRQQEIQNRQSGISTPASTSTAKPDSHNSSSSGKGTPKGGKDSRGGHKRAPSTADLKNMPIRGGQQSATAPAEPEKEDKTVELFRHLYKPRANTIAAAGKEVHPAVLALGQQMSSYIVCGSNARLVATLEAFKRVCPH
jgi:translation initiation factor eIF-2B subunit delta